MPVHCIVCQKTIGGRPYNWLRHCTTEAHIRSQVYVEMILNREDNQFRAWEEFVAQTDLRNQLAQYLTKQAKVDIYKEWYDVAVSLAQHHQGWTSNEGMILDTEEFGPELCSHEEETHDQLPIVEGDPNTEDEASDSEDGLEASHDLEHSEVPLDTDAFGSSRYWKPHHWFDPTDLRENGCHQIRTQPENIWFLFESELFALLFMLVHGANSTMSSRDLKLVWYILNQVLKVPVLSLDRIKKFAHMEVPVPRIFRCVAKDNLPKPFYQVSICDLIRMQLAIPTVAARLVEVPVDEETHDKSIPRDELWSGEKWHRTS